MRTFDFRSRSGQPGKVAARRRTDFERDGRRNGKWRLFPMSNADRFWYVLRTSFYKELYIQVQLSKMRIRSYIPMRHEEVIESGRRKIRRVPAIHNLIFVRITSQWLVKLRADKLIPAKCIYDRTTQKPLIVPDKQMDDFIALTEGKYEDVCIVDPALEEIERGERVRITGGPFSGIEGEYVHYKSKNRVIVRIEGFAAITTAEVPEAFIERIANE